MNTIPIHKLIMILPTSNVSRLGYFSVNISRNESHSIRELYFHLTATAHLLKNSKWNMSPA